jgi:hypothetical protein
MIVRAGDLRGIAGPRSDRSAAFDRKKGGSRNRRAGIRVAPDVRVRYTRCVGLIRLTARGFLAGAFAGVAVYLVLAQLILGHVWPRSR